MQRMSAMGRSPTAVLGGKRTLQSCHFGSKLLTHLGGREMRAFAFSAASLAALSGSAVAQQADFEPQVKQEITAAVQAFFDGFNTATCEDGHSVSDLATDPTIFVEETEIYRTSADEFEQVVRELACNWTKHEGGVDDLVVEAHAPNVATAAWTFHTIVTRKDGSVSRTKGAGMQTWVKVASGWKVAATKSSEVQANAVIEPPPGE